MKRIEDHGQDDMLFLFKRPFNEEYQRRIITILGLTKGLTFEVPYRQKYLSPSVRATVSKDPSAFEGKKAISFCVDADSDQSHLTFYPLRECTMRKVWQPEGSDDVYFLFEVGNYVLCEPSKCTGELLQKYGKNGLPPQCEGAYVMSGQKLNSVASVDFTEHHWDKEVQQLKNIQQLKEHAFYQLLSLVNQQELAVVPQDMNSEKGYKLKGGRKYRARLSIRLPYCYESGGRYRTKIACILGNGLETVGPSEAEIRAPRETKDYFEFICKRINQTTKLSIQDGEKEFSAPKFDILVRISSPPEWLKIVGGIIAFSAASALAASQPFHVAWTAAAAGLLYYLGVHVLLR